MQSINIKTMRAALGSLIFMCAQHSILAAPPAQPSTAAPVSASAKAEAVPSSDIGSQYIIGPGDGIQVFVWRNPELSVTVPVRPDGKISTPLVEDIVAVGKTPSQLARDVEAKLGEFIRSPQVSIIVGNALSAYSQIKVIGQVARPQSLPFREGMTLLDVALTVGGLTDFAAGNRTKLIRKDEKGHEKTIKVRLEDLLRKGKISENVQLKPGDVLIVPESVF